MRLEQVGAKLDTYLGGLWKKSQETGDHDDFSVEVLQLQVEVEQLKEKARESMRDLTDAIEDIGWTELGPNKDNWEMPRKSLVKLCALSRKFSLKNPLVQRAVDVQALYVWAQGCKWKAKHPVVQEVIDDFYNSAHNKCVVGPAYIDREREQRILGNQFFALWTNTSTGAVRIRTFKFEEITHIVSNPDDCKEPWYYIRTHSTPDGKTHVQAYPDVNYTPSKKPGTVTYCQGGTAPIEWRAPVIHLKTGGLPEMLWGMPELYSVLDWAMHYKILLENWASIIQSYARMAMKVSGLQGKAGVAAAKSKLNTTASSSKFDTNPSNLTASTFLSAGGVEISAVKTAGATTSAEEGRPLKIMVASGSGIPDTFFGDADVGNYATSQTLDRPTELKFVNRRTFWENFMDTLHGYLLLQATKARKGKLYAIGARVVTTPNPFDYNREQTVVMPNNRDEKYGPVDKPISLMVTTLFPQILERNATERVRAVVQAITLGGSPAEGIIPDRKMAAGLLLEALQVPDWADRLDEMYPKGPVIQGFVDPKEEMDLQVQAQKDQAKAAKANKGKQNASQD